MKLEDFDPPVINERTAREKSSPELEAEIYGLNYEKMTARKLKWLIALSGEANPMYTGKGKTRRKGGKPVDLNRFPKKAERDEDGKVVGPGSKPSTPFPRECPNGKPNCIAREANKIVQKYWSKVRIGLADSPRDLSGPQHSKDATRKQWKMPKKTVDSSGQKKWAAARPSGTYAQTGLAKNWEYQAQIDRAADPRMKAVVKDNERLARQLALANKENKAPDKKNKAPGAEDQPKPGVRVRKRKKKRPQPEAKAKADSDKQDDRIANMRKSKRKSKSQARSGPPGAGRGKIDLNSINRDYTSTNNINENINQALYG